MNTIIIRQGDCLIRRIGDCPSAAVGKADPTLIEGEHSGHSHTLMGGVLLADGTFAVADAARLVHLQHGQEVEHPDHFPLAVPSGLWERIPQIEYDPVMPRQVQD